MQFCPILDDFWLRFLFVIEKMNDVKLGSGRNQHESSFVFQYSAIIFIQHSTEIACVDGFQN